MKRTIFARFAAILALALIVSSVVSVVLFGLKQTDLKSQELTRIAMIMSGQFEPSEDNNEQAKLFAGMTQGIRVTVIASDGTVTGDSDADYKTMDNHSSRPEIMEARGTARAVSARQSWTLGSRLIYAAIKTPDGHFIRLSEEYGSAFWDLLTLVPGTLATAILALIVSGFFARRFAGRITGIITDITSALNRVKDGGAALEPTKYRYEELQDMAAGINILAADVTKYIDKLKEEQRKTGFILDNMKEGVLLLDKTQTVSFINDSACAYLDCDKAVTGKNVSYSARNAEFLNGAEKAMSEGKNLSIDILIGGRFIETIFSLAATDKEENELIVTMNDVTENRKSIQMRRDFFTDASHELKTPITAIKGGAEVLLSDMPLEKEQQRELLSRIGIEADRLCSVINDIIMINRLESGESAGEKEDIDFAAVVSDCLKEAKTMAEREGLKLNSDIDPAVVQAVKKNLYEIAGNLITNAVLYNRPGGSVDVSLKKAGGEVWFTVRNDGEPIPPDHQKRVFERFYRVEGSRGKASGGTGLGLSIVKHAVESLGGVVKLESNRKSGTTFTVVLPSDM